MSDSGSASKSPCLPALSGALPAPHTAMPGHGKAAIRPRVHQSCPRGQGTELPGHRPGGVETVWRFGMQPMGSCVVRLAPLGASSGPTQPVDTVVLPDMGHLHLGGRLRICGRRAATRGDDRRCEERRVCCSSARPARTWRGPVRVAVTKSRHPDSCNEPKGLITPGRM